MDRLGIEPTVVGKHGGARSVGKGSALAGRSARLWRWASGRGFELALAHGSVDISLVCRSRRIPLVQMNDYEHAGRSGGSACAAAGGDRSRRDPGRGDGARRRAAPETLFRYPGLKEDYYLAA